MKKAILYFVVLLLTQWQYIHAQGIPNNDFENWVALSHYDDPQNWDTPNQEVCTFPFYTNVVSKSTDHYSGSLSAKLESKTIPIIGVVVPGVVTLGTMTIDLLGASYSITGGVPITVPPTFVRGFFKFIPKGGDSCAIGVGLTQWKNGARDSVGVGWYSTHDTITTWTPFSAWVNLDSLTVPDTMNIIALSSATETPTDGTVLYLDGLYLDYTVGINHEDPATGIQIYQDREVKQLLVYLDFPQTQTTMVRMYNMMGRKLWEVPPCALKKDRFIMNYSDFSPGIYILEIIHNNKKYCRKFLFNN
ncbi:MAG: T9SS type A sorting domain-containing protein [Bacteroidota bacterium]